MLIFIEQIMAEQAPLRFKILQIEQCDETTNPDDHLDSFKALLYTKSVAITYHAFMATLKKAT